MTIYYYVMLIQTIQKNLRLISTYILISQVRYYILYKYKVHV